MKIFRGALLIACCWALTTAAPAPQTPVDAFAEDIGPEPPLNAFLKTLTTVTDLLNRFSRTFTAPAEYTEFSDVEVAKPRVTLVEEKDASGADVYKVTIVRPADSGVTFARQMESTTGAPPAPSSTTTTVAPTQDPPMFPSQGLRTRDTIHQQQQPKYHTKHELFSDEEKKDVSVYPPILFLLKNPRRQQFLQQQQRSQPISYQPFEREDIDSMEDINRSGNRLDEDEAGEGEFAEFEREWHFHPQPHFGDDMRVNRIFRTRNADYYNPDAESFHVPSSPQRVVYRPQAPQIPIK